MVWASLVAGLAAVWGLLLRRRLQMLAYRTEDERRTPPQGSRWWVVPVLAASAWLLTTRVQETALAVDARVALLLTMVVLAGACVALAAIDLDVHRLPDRIVAGTGGVLLIGLSLASVLDAGVGPWWRAWACALASGALYLLLALLTLARGSLGVGLGDVKLSMLLGAALGWFGVQNAVVGIYAGFVIGGALALTLLLSGRVGLRGHLAYGPPMMLGALVGILLPSDILQRLF
ncbi:MAG: A24 family peptidase [Ornithinimicrobium sp.]